MKDALPITKNQGTNNYQGMFSFEQLRIYQEALGFVDAIYCLTKSWPKEEMFGLTDQLRRAAVSILLNIAEGSSRTKKDFCHFLDLSKGSCFECVAILQVARKRKYMTEEEYQKFYSWCLQIAKSLSALKSSILKNEK